MSQVRPTSGRPAGGAAHLRNRSDARIPRLVWFWPDAIAQTSKSRGSHGCATLGIHLAALPTRATRPGMPSRRRLASAAPSAARLHFLL